VRLLLDTHCFLWWFADDRRLGERARELIGDGDNDVFVSAASSWEIAIKASLGKLTLPEPPDVYVPARLASQEMRGLPIEHVHALRVASLPAYHQDPFDRLIVAQAQLEKLPILTVDENIAAYEVDAVWAGHGDAPWSMSSKS
jgi:PIN domain nuclease of toxin-antitoxin system